LALGCLLPLPLAAQTEGESFRAAIVGTLEVSLNNPGGSSLSLSYTDSALITLDRETRFFRGIELEFTAPPAYLPHRGSLAIVLYTELSPSPAPGIVDIRGRSIHFEPVPNKIQTVYQIPLRAGHGLRTSPYVTLIPGQLSSPAFPLLFRVMPIIKGISEEVEGFRFTLTVKPILRDEGAVRVGFRYPENLLGRPVTLLIDDTVIENPAEELLLREGEHHLLILSSDYRNENRLFLVERGKILDLNIELQDPAPMVIFEAPENAQIFFDNQLLTAPRDPLMVEPGVHEVRFQMSDYAIVKSLVVQKGKTYRVAMSVDVQVTETD
jgi:hypothetical protein